MDIGVIAKRYARALLQYATEQKADAAVYAEVLQFIDGYGKVPTLAEVLHDPLLAPADKERVICQAATVAGASSVSPVFQRFAALVVAHRREVIMTFIAHSYVDLYRRHKGISIGRLTTAAPVSEETRERLQQWVQRTAGDGIDVQLEANVNPDLLGGFVFQMDDRRLDASVASQLEKIKKQLIEKNNRIV